MTIPRAVCRIAVVFGRFFRDTRCLRSRDGYWLRKREMQGLAIVDPAAGKVIASVPEGGVTGHEVIASPDGRLAYVPIYGNSGVGKPGTDGANLVVIDIAAQKVVGNLDFGHGVRPHMPIFGPKDGLLYVTTELDQSVTLIDPKTLKIVGSIPTGQAGEPHAGALSRRPPRLHRQRRTRHRFGPRHRGAQDDCKIIPISGNTQRISISNDDRWVFTADQTKPRLAVIDTASNDVKTLDSARGSWLWKRAHAGWPLADHCDSG